MLTIQNYVRAGSLEEAYALCQKKNNVVLGGMLWLKMQRNRVDTAIDLSGLGLDQIEETDSDYHLGAMVTLRQLELHPGLDRLTQGAMAESVRHIVGVQFRNLATVGGSVFGRFGFSDVLTLLLALEARVVLYHGGEQSLADFAAAPRQRDILTHVIIPEIRQGIITGAMLAFTLSLDDFTISYFTTSPMVQNLSTLIYSKARIGIDPTLNALSALMFVALLVLLIIVNRRTADNSQKA